MDMLLTDNGVSGLRRWVPGPSGLKAAARLAARPDRVVRRYAGFAAETAKIAAGRSEVAPPKGDRRFKDAAWEQNPAFRRLGQFYLLWGSSLDGLIDDADLDWVDEQRVRFATDNLVSALAPTNFPAANPAVLKATLDQGGANLVKGSTQLVRDMARSPRIPTMVDTSEFDVGKNIAVTPGQVVKRTEVFELIQYQPQTAKVRTAPLLVVPPMINKYYVTDLAPDRSMIEHVVKSGQQAFAISWRNPDERFAAWDLDTYAEAVLEALTTVEKITRTRGTQVLALCAGGIVASAVTAHLAANDEQDRVAGLTLGVCVLDNKHAGTASSFVDREVAALAVADSARRGYLSGRSLAGVFAWLRPNDLVWNYWVNNYLLGKDPPAFDILFWNSDTTNLAAGLHRDFMQLTVENSMVHPGEMEVLGTPIDLSKITVDSYVVAGIGDHIIPWESAYRTTQLFGSDPRFVLSTSGHIAAMVNPPGNEKASFRIAKRNPQDPEAWLSSASEQKGTWWDDWVEWLGKRSGPEKKAPAKLGARGAKPIQKAPGRYVKG